MLIVRQEPPLRCGGTELFRAATSPTIPMATPMFAPAAKKRKKYNRAFSKPRHGLTKDGTLLYFARKQDCDALRA
jgi:hypothetical protein